MSDYNAIHKVIEQEAVTSYLQPIVHARKQCVWGYEALSRGPLLSRLRSPLKLCECAAKFDLESKLESLCIVNALKSFASIPLKCRLFLNVSYNTLNDYDQFELTLKTALQRYAIEPKKLVLELTEHSPIGDIGRLKMVVGKLRRMGFSIALDDLGAGYSSLQLWSELDPDYIKFDRHFIHNIGEDTVKQRFVRSLTDIARNQGCRVIAEGVETKEEAEWLAQMQVRFMQGYYFGRPCIRARQPSACRFPSYNNRPAPISRSLTHRIKRAIYA